MCGRYSITTAPEAMRRLFEVPEMINLAPRYNMAPTQSAPVVRLIQGVRQLGQLHWGLVPPWSKDAAGAARLINARSETVDEKPSFRSAYQARRCLVPADGFYEWKTEAGVKQPYRIVVDGGQPIAFAGLWERWEPAGGEALESFTILTTEAAESIREIHHRMPVILPVVAHEAWLAGPVEATAQWLKPYPADDIAGYRVSTRLNKVVNDDASLFEQTEAPPPPPPPAQGNLF